MNRIEREADATPRNLGNQERWHGDDDGLIWCWERGREKLSEDPQLAGRCAAGELPVLAWAGGVDAKLVAERRGGTLRYLATWQGIRGEPLRIDRTAEVSLTCSRTGQEVVFCREWQKVK